MLLLCISLVTAPSPLPKNHWSHTGLSSSSALSLLHGTTLAWPSKTVVVVLRVVGNQSFTFSEKDTSRTHREFSKHMYNVCIFRTRTAQVQPLVCITLCMAVSSILHQCVYSRTIVYITTIQVTPEKRFICVISLCKEGTGLVPEKPNRPQLSREYWI